jgi:hypothetical protein
MSRPSAATHEMLQRDLNALPIVAEPSPTLGASAVSWAAIVAGAAGAAALSLILLTLGVGLGMATMSPWAPDSITAAELGVSSIVWLAVTSILASVLGGYLAGRLRTRWPDAQADEVYFRDTAHGFLTWAVATLLTATLLTSAVASIVGNGVQAGATVAGAAASTALSNSVSTENAVDESRMGYFVDRLFRPDPNTPAASWSEGVPTERSRADDAREVRRIFSQALGSAPLPPDDVSHLGQLVARHTGLSPAAAEARVDETYARTQAAIDEAELRAKEAADAARRATAHGSLWLFIALLAGAFFASLAATFGGRQRDL